MPSLPNPFPNQLLAKKKGSRLQSANMVLNALVKRIAVKCSHVQTMLIIIFKYSVVLMLQSAIIKCSKSLEGMQLTQQLSYTRVYPRPQASLFWWWACFIWWCSGMWVEWVGRFRLWLNPLRIQMIQRLWSRSRLWLNPPALYPSRTLQAYPLHWSPSNHQIIIWLCVHITVWSNLSWYIHNVIQSFSS